jgi:hypothetical protein
MEPHEYEALVKDIKVNGQRLRAYTVGTEIIDGWHRYQACLENGLELRIDDMAPRLAKLSEAKREAQLYAFVISLNMQRRHLTTAQRAQIAVDLNLDYGITVKQVAKDLKVGKRTVERAKAVRLGHTQKPPNGGFDLDKKGAPEDNSVFEGTKSTPPEKTEEIIDVDVSAPEKRPNSESGLAEKAQFDLALRKYIEADIERRKDCGSHRNALDLQIAKMEKAYDRDRQKGTFDKTPK